VAITKSKNKIKISFHNFISYAFASPGAERSAHIKQTEIIENTKIKLRKMWGGGREEAKAKLLAKNK